MYLCRTIELSRFLKKFASSIFSISMVTTLQEKHMNMSSGSTSEGWKIDMTNKLTVWFLFFSLTCLSTPCWQSYTLWFTTRNGMWSKRRLPSSHNTLCLCELISVNRQKTYVEAFYYILKQATLLPLTWSCSLLGLVKSTTQLLPHIIVTKYRYVLFPLSEST